MAAQFVRRQSVDDVVNSAVILFVESLQRPEKPARIPATEDEFRGRFLAIVRNHAIDCVRDSDGPERPIHCHWAKAPEPAVGGRKVADRELDQVFARNDHGKYDAPAPTERRAKDDVDELYQIIRCHLDDLSHARREIIVETFFEGRKRAEVAARHGISVYTYDNHLQAAFRSLRDSMTQVVDISSDLDRPHWYDVVEKLSERHAAARLRRVSGKKGKRSTSEGDRSNFEGDRSNFEGDRSNFEGDRSNFEGDRSNFEGDRSNSQRDRGKNSRAGAA
jgi:DNA-directed RNA polymerase specialized sigma24 family protein